MWRTLVPAVCLAWLCHAPMASAYTFAPKGAHFTSVGKMRLSAGGLGANCTTVFEAVTDAAGAGAIVRASFSGGLLGACDSLRPVGLPWAITPVAANQAVISAVAVRSPWIGDCGPSDVPITLADGGAIRLGRVPLRPRCSINGGALVAKPVLAVVGR